MTDTKGLTNCEVKIGPERKHWGTIKLDRSAIPKAGTSFQLPAHAQAHTVDAVVPYDSINTCVLYLLEE